MPKRLGTAGLRNPGNSYIIKKIPSGARTRHLSLKWWSRGNQKSGGKPLRRDSANKYLDPLSLPTFILQAFYHEKRGRAKGWTATADECVLVYHPNQSFPRSVLQPLPLSFHWSELLLGHPLAERWSERQGCGKGSAQPTCSAWYTQKCLMIHTSSYLLLVNERTGTRGLSFQSWCFFSLHLVLLVIIAV